MLTTRHLARALPAKTELDVQYMVSCAGFDARKERELLKWDYLVFFVFDQNSISRGEDSP